MSLLNEIPPDDAEGRLAALYTVFQQTLGFIPKAFQMASVSPELLEQHWRYLSYYLRHPELSPALTACIRLLVSKRAACRYCVDLNRALLVQNGATPEVIEAMTTDPSQAPLSAKERALLQFTLRATADPHAIEAADIQALRALGYSDQVIFDALHHGARQIAFDILIDAFKVEPEGF